MSDIAARIARERRLVDAKRLRYGLDFAQYYHRWYNQRLLDALAADGALRVLDCGCGTGVFLPALEQRYRYTVGLDFCRDNLLAASAVNGRAALLIGDIGRLPVAPQSFDQIVCRGVLHRLDDLDTAFRQLFAALRDGGDLVIAEPVGDSRALNLLRLAARTAGRHPFPAGRVTHATTREWIAAAQRAGFRTVRSHPLGYVAFPLLGFPDAIPLVRHLPARMTLARMLLGLDRVLARIPYANRWSWQAVFHFRKPPAPAADPPS